MPIKFAIATHSEPKTKKQKKHTHIRGKFASIIIKINRIYLQLLLPEYDVEDRLPEGLGHAQTHLSAHQSVKNSEYMFRDD